MSNRSYEQGGDEIREPSLSERWLERFGLSGQADLPIGSDENGAPILLRDFLHICPAGVEETLIGLEALEGTTNPQEREMYDVTVAWVKHHLNKKMGQ